MKKMLLITLSVLFMFANTFAKQPVSEKNDKPLPPITSASKRATPPRKSTLG